MTSRLNLGKARAYVESVSGDSDGENPPKPVPVQPQVTAGIVDEAVEDVLSQTDFPEDTKEAMRKLLATDADTGFAASYHRAKLRPVNVHSRLKKDTISISYVLTPEETADLVAYAPEFELRFLDTDNHDHAMAAAMRIIDTAVVLGKTPKGVVVKDVGGDPLQHVRREVEDVHVCAPVLDLKDPTRAPMRMMAAKRLLATSTSEVQKVLARMYIEQDKRFVCNRKAEDCDYQAKLSMSIHVYDVPIDMWPVIMARCGAVVHEGVVLYPLAALDSTVGVLSKARARFEVDVASDRFCMGFANSPSWWYDHSWSRFMRYGSDQIINYDGVRYSYRVTERRGDTLFFRIVKLDGEVGRIGRQYYNVPGVRMVRVEGFVYDPREKFKAKSGAVLRARREPAYFPARLWKDMLQEAMMRFEHGDLSFDKMYNYYRTVSPRHTVNGVLVSGGERVGKDQIVDLVVRSGLCAAAKVMLEQRTSRVVTAAAMADREFYSRSGWSQVMSVFFGSVLTVAKSLVYYPLVWFCDLLLSNYASGMQAELSSWADEPEVKEFPFSSLVSVELRDKYYSWVHRDETVVDPEFMLDHYAANAAADHFRAIKDHPNLARIVKETCGDMSADKLSETVNAGVSVSENEETVIGSEKTSSLVTDEQVNMRRNAIRECVEESRLEQQKLRGMCERVYGACTDSKGDPIQSMLTRRAEEFYQPDLWWVSAGIIAKSQLGVDGKECKYSALYTPRPDKHGEVFRTVKDEVYENDEGESTDYRVFTSTDYTGWALSMERLAIYNGPEIQETLEIALNCEHRYVVILKQGPPGCGKTYDLLNAMDEQDVAMCPVRESAMDTRARLGEKKPQFPNLRGRVRTIDSYLVNYGSDRVKSIAARALHADEVYMSHSGKWYAAAALLGVQVVYAYGDEEQIPHVSRVQAASAYLRVIANEKHVKFDIYRCPADALAAWGFIYEWRARTHSKVKNSMRVETDASTLVMPNGCVLMCMYQADKKQLLHKYAMAVSKKGVRVMTVHESEGKTFKDVWFFRFDTRVRQDDMSLYDKQAYALVAMSRHTHTFVYIRPRNLNDKIDQWYARSQNVRAIAAAVDLKSVGITKQFV